MMRALVRGTCALAATAGITTAGAQVSDPQAGAGVVMESYKFGSAQLTNIDKISLFTVPIVARANLLPQLDLTVNGAFASANLTRPNGTSTSLSGLTDTEIRLTYTTMGDRVRLSAVGLAPTGKSKLSADEMDVMGVIAADLLPFTISNWGSGGGLGVNAAVAMPLSDRSTLGVSTGFVAARKYEPLSATSFAYRPGNQLQVRAAADRTFGASAKGSLQVAYLHYSQDQNAGVNFYQAGDRLQASSSLAFAAGANGTGIVYLGYLRRGEGKYTSVVRVTPAQDLVYAGTAFRRPMGGNVLVPSLDVRLLGNESGVDQGRTISAGLGVEIPRNSFEMYPQAKARFGQLTMRSSQSSNFTGFEVGLTIRSRMLSQ